MILHLLIGVTLSACASDEAEQKKIPPDGSPAKLELKAVTFSQLPGWNTGSQEKALITLLRSCAAFARRPDARLLRADGLGGKIGDWRLVCGAAADQKLARTNRMAVRAFFEIWFKPFEISDRGKNSGLFTGYFEPQLRGSWRRTARFNIPLYRRPPDLISVDLGRFRSQMKGMAISGALRGNRLVPFAERQAIRRGALAGRGLELLWVDSAVDAFFLHIQGSGRVMMEDGSIVRVGFAGRNGRPYRAIGRELVAMGAMELDQVSMQSIRAWLAANPSQAASVMDRNLSYIFFRRIKGAGPLGAQGIALTPGRSLAVDRRFLPLGAPFWLDITDPLDKQRPLRRLVVAQDTGGAITGPVRGDLFWGFGRQAREKAGRMRSTGRYFILLPKFLPQPPGAG